MSRWTTWEELLLTSAVKRHGLKDWSAIAMELQSRASSVPNPIMLTAQICRTKFHDLRRRFTENTASDRNDVVGRRGVEVDDDCGGDDNSVPWLEDLKELRMAELRQKVHGHGVSIQSLNSKVKRLEEERERNMRENENGDQKPDLEKDSMEERSENDKNDVTGGVLPEDDVAGVSVSGERSERENRSVNESNTTENRQTGERVEERETELVHTGSVKQDPETKSGRANSWHDSSKPSEDKKVDGESAELSDSAAVESKEGTKESSDVQSSASLTRKGGGAAAVSGGDEPVISPATMRRDSAKKSEPLVGFLDIIRAHKHGSVFEIRLESQKTEKYKSTIRQHVDLETVQTRMEDGSYSSCTTKFYLDLFLLVNNAIVFFPKASAESAAAFELRKLVLKDINKKRIGRQSNPSSESAPIILKPKPDPERSDSLLAKQKSSAPLIVCRKRSSISGKQPTSNKSEKQTDGKPGVNRKPPVKSSSSSPNEEESSIKLKLKEKPVTGVRSLRRSSNTHTNSTTNLTKYPITNSSSKPGSTNKGEAQKIEKKKTEVTNMVKKRGAADFLKRIKKSSPAKRTLFETLKSSPEDSNGSSRRESIDQQKKRVDERKEVTARQKGGGDGGSGGAGGKKVREDNSPSKRGVGRPPKRGREAAPVKRGKERGEMEVAARRPNKRTKR